MDTVLKQTCVVTKPVQVYGKEAKRPPAYSTDQIHASPILSFTGPLDSHTKSPSILLILLVLKLLRLFLSLFPFNALPNLWIKFIHICLLPK